MKTNNQPCAFVAKRFEALQEILNIGKCVQDIGQNDDIKSAWIVESLLANDASIYLMNLQVLMALLGCCCQSWIAFNANANIGIQAGQ